MWRFKRESIWFIWMFGITLLKAIPTPQQENDHMTTQPEVWQPPGGISQEEWYKCQGIPCDQWQSLQQKTAWFQCYLEAEEGDLDAAVICNTSRLEPYLASLEASRNQSYSVDEDEPVLAGDIWFTETQIDDIVNVIENKKQQQQQQQQNSSEDSTGSGDFEDSTEEDESVLKRKKRKLDIYAAAWSWDLPIRYKFDGQQGDYEKDIIKKAIAHWEEHTCIDFMEIDVNVFYDGSHLIFTNQITGCHSWIGRLFAYPQPINLQYQCLNRFGVPVHEIGHAMGLWHEHQRDVRDGSVKVHYQNINRYRSQFEIKDTVDYGLEYDVGSVMHYAPLDGSSNGGYVLTPNDPLYMGNMGQRTGLSFTDAQVINRHYCQAAGRCDIDMTPQCLRGGYQHPRLCDYCMCPPGFSGKYCHELEPSNAACGGIVQLSSRRPSALVNTPGYGSRGYEINTKCNWYVKASTGLRISIEFEEPFSLYCNRGTECFHWVEVKYKGRLDTQGPRFCCTNPNITITSDNNEMLLIFRSEYERIFSFSKVGFQAWVFIEDITTQSTTTTTQPTTTTTQPTTTTTQPTTTTTQPRTTTKQLTTTTTQPRTTTTQTTTTTTQPRTTTTQPKTTTTQPTTTQSTTTTAQPTRTTMQPTTTTTMQPTTTTTQPTTTTTQPRTTTKQLTTTTTQPRTTTTQTTTTTTQPRTTTTQPKTTTTQPTTTQSTTTTAQPTRTTMQPTTTTTMQPTTTTTQPITTLQPTTTTTQKTTTTQQTTTTQPTTTTMQPPTTTFKDCDTMADLAFVIDSSSSVGEDNWMLVKRFVILLIERMSLQDRCTRLALITYQNTADVNVYFSYPYSSTHLVRELGSTLSYKGNDVGGWYSDTSAALELLLNQVYTVYNGHRQQAKKVAMIISGGTDNIGINPNAISQKLRQENIVLFGIGVGRNVDIRQLDDIVGSNDMVYELQDVDILVQNYAIDYFIQEINRVIQRPTTHMPTTTTTIPTTTQRIVPTGEPYSFKCTFEPTATDRVNMCGITQLKDDHFDWTRQKGKTMSVQTGPKRAHNGLYYIYIEASNPRKYGDIARISLPAVPSSQYYCLSFYYHMQGFHVNSLTVYKQGPGNGDKPREIWREKRLIGDDRNTEDKWIRALYEKLSLQENEKIVFEGMCGEEFSGDIALDDISLTSC